MSSDYYELDEFKDTYPEIATEVNDGASKSKKKSTKYCYTTLCPILYEYNMEPAHSEISNPCRICFENTPPLIHPCKCSGSSKYVHLVCLKTWISSQHSNPKGSQCEVCRTKYKMKISTSKSLSCKANRSKIWLNFPILAIVQSFIALMIYFLAVSYEAVEGLGSKLVIIILIVLCAFTSVLSIAVFLVSTKQMSVVETINNWEIENWVPNMRQVVPM